MSIKDVARLADVSYQTVSRVINDDPRVSDRTRDHVWRIIQSTGFVPNPAARALVMRRSSLIGI
ncbi:LacI family DNA-binding transcriptional regulator, partial [Propionibacterium acidifaciens]